MLHLAAQSQRLGTNLNPGRTQRIRGLIPVTALDASATALALSNFDVEAGRDRLDGRDISMILLLDFHHFYLTTTIWTRVERQFDLFGVIDHIGNRPMSRWMAFLATRALGILLGLAFGKRRSLALAGSV